MLVLSINKKYFKYKNKIKQNKIKFNIILHTGFKSGEYGGKYSTWIPFALHMSSKYCPLWIDALSNIKTL